MDSGVLSAEGTYPYSQIAQCYHHAFVAFALRRFANRASAPDRWRMIVRDDSLYTVQIGAVDHASGKRARSRCMRRRGGCTWHEQPAGLIGNARSKQTSVHRS